MSTLNQIFSSTKPTYTKISVPDNVMAWQIDLMDVNRLSSANRNVRYLMNCVDVHSRYVFSFPLKNKTTVSTSKALLEMLDKLKKMKTYLYDEITIRTDDGKEFKNDFAKVMRLNNIKHYIADPHVPSGKTSMGIVERFNRTLWGLINKYQFERGTMNFVDGLDDIIDMYNRRLHSTILTSPLKAIKGGKMTMTYTVKPDKLKVGDYVRRRLVLDAFEKKSYVPRLSLEIYIVVSLNPIVVVNPKTKKEHHFSRSDIQIVKRPNDLHKDYSDVYNKMVKVSLDRDAERQNIKSGLDYSKEERRIVMPVTPMRSKRKIVPKKRFDIDK